MDVDAPKPHKIAIAESTWKRLNAANDIVRRGQCETKLQHVAQTGEKIMTVISGADVWTCRFNFSDSDVLNDVAAAFQDIATTMDAGDKLSSDSRFSRLALDEDLDKLMADIKDGRAIEVQNIASVLKSIVNDERVMERVRRKASHILVDAGVTAAVP